MASQSRWRRAVLVHPPEPLRHPDDRSVLRLELLEVALSALDDEHRLRQIRRVDDRDLRAGWRGRQDEDDRSDKVRRIMDSPPRSESSRLRSRIRWKLQVARQVHLHPVSLANRDGWQTIQKPAHDLQACLRRGVGAAGDDDRPVAVPADKPAVPIHCARPLIRPTAAAAPNVDQ